MTGAGQGLPDGLRERKKARTRASLREHALRLFREQRYQATTAGQIAAAAEVSPGTFFRYFPTKEDVVLQDDMDTRMVEALERQPAGLSPITAARTATREVFASYSAADLDLIQEITTLTVTVPGVRARALDEFARTTAVMSRPAALRPADRPAAAPARGLRAAADRERHNGRGHNGEPGSLVGMIELGSRPCTAAFCHRH